MAWKKSAFSKSLKVHVQNIYFWNDIKQNLSICNSEYDTVLD